MQTLTPTWLSVLPALVTIILAFSVREVLLALLVGILTGGVVLYTMTGQLSNLNVINQFILPALGSESYATILLIYLWCLGGLIGIWYQTGAAVYFANFVGRHLVKGPRSAKLFAWLMGAVFHQGGTISSILAGTTVKPVTDAQKISHEELAYLVDSTGSPFATIIPFNTWPIYIAGLVVGTIPLFAATNDIFPFYLKSLAFNFYAIFTVIFTLLFSLDLLPWIGNKMKAAQLRARETGKLDRTDAHIMMKPKVPDLNALKTYPVGLIDFFLPLGILLSVIIIPFVLWQIGLISQNFSNWIKEGFALATLSSIILAVAKGMKLKDAVTGFINGCQSVTLGAIILGMAVTLGYITKTLNTADYITQIIGHSLPFYLLPAITTIICMAISFSTGSSWGTYAVVFPIAMPLAYALNADPLYLQICFGAVLGGALFGDQCSPISDTTIMSSIFSGCDLMDHVTTQVPLAMTCALLSIICSTGLCYYLI